MCTVLLGYMGSWKCQETNLRKDALKDGYWKIEVLEQLLSDNFEANQSNMNPLESEDSDVWGIEIHFDY